MEDLYWTIPHGSRKGPEILSYSQEGTKPDYENYLSTTTSQGYPLLLWPPQAKDPELPDNNLMMVGSQASSDDQNIRIPILIVHLLRSQFLKLVEPIR